MRPGNTSLPVTSITSLALVGRMSGCTEAILPLRMATSLMPSMPEAGQITRPPRRSWSKLALIDIAISSVFGPAALAPPPLEIRSILRILQKQSSCHDLFVASALESGYSRRVPRLGECVAEGKKSARRDQAPPLAVVTTAGISDPAATPDPRRAVPGSLRGIRDHAATIQPAVRACSAGNRRSDHVSGRYRAGPDD